MSRNTFRTGSAGHVITLAGILCLLLWIIDAALDSLLLGTLSFQQHLLFPETHKIVNYAQAAIIVFILAIYTLYLIKSRRESEGELREKLSAVTAEKLRSDGILDSLGDAVSIQDTSFRVIYQNPAHQELMGEHVGELCYEAYQKRRKVCDDCLLVRAFRDGSRLTCVKEGSSAHGPVTVEITASVLRDSDGSVIAGIESVRDISERKRIEDEIVRLNGDLMRQAEELKAVNNDLETFCYSVSHDLRTPLARILCSADVLRKEYSHQVDEEGRFFLESLEVSSRRMMETIETMLDLARVNRSEMVFHDIDMGHLAHSIFLELHRDLPLRKVEFSVCEDAMVVGDERMLRVALNNLIENALKFTRERDPALITVGGEQRGDEHVWFVRDNGAGFDMAHADRLFKPFNRLHALEEFPGTGIGLAIVQRVIQRHGGRIWAEATPGQGATFYFTLPEREMRKAC